jgi:hypothetical protein
MAKKVPCQLVIGTRTRMIVLGSFNSKAEAKKYVAECGPFRYYDIIPK